MYTYTINLLCFWQDRTEFLTYLFFAPSLVISWQWSKTCLWNKPFPSNRRFCSKHLDFCYFMYSLLLLPSFLDFLIIASWFFLLVLGKTNEKKVNNNNQTECYQSSGFQLTIATEIGPSWLQTIGTYKWNFFSFIWLVTWCFLSYRFFFCRRI